LYYWETRVSGGPVSIRTVLGPRWNALHVGSVSRCHSLGQGILPDAITTVPRGQRSCRSAPRIIRPPALDINYTSCLTRQGGRLTNVGNLMGCSESWSFNSFTSQSTLSVGRADIWWYCGGPLLETLPGNWAGTCALVQLGNPFHPSI
jgi:hypothetical protein